MLVSYRDAISEVHVIVDECGISCVDGNAYFTEAGTQKAYCIPVTWLRMIL